MYTAARMAAKPACDRTCLEGIASKYLDAMVAHDPSRAPLSAAVKYSQDNVPLKIGQALWATTTKRGKYVHYFADPEQGDVGGHVVSLARRSFVRDRRRGSI